MIELLPLAAAAGAGLLLGAVFFAGLWWTVNKGLGSRRPALWFLCSLLLRSGIVIGGFTLVGGGEWRRLAACALGFVAARWFVTLRYGEGARHAP